MTADVRLPCAQNILQLQTQVREADVSPEGQALLSAAHQLASELFSGQTRAPGKPFIDHLVGTASVLAACGAPLPVVVAGLLHAAYDAGDFGLGLLGRHGAKRAEMQRVVGADAEEYVDRYHRLRWTTDYIRSLGATAKTLALRDQHLVMIRLANELEEHLDWAIQFCANADERLARLNSLGPSLVNAAEGIGQPLLANELQRIIVENQTACVPARLRSQASSSFMRPPRSYARRLSARMRSLLTRRR